MIWIVVVIVVVALILAVVVPFFVLSSLIGGLSRTSVPPQVIVGMSIASFAGPMGTPASYFVNLSLSTSGVVSTTDIGLQLRNLTSEAGQAVLTPSSSCSYGARADSTNCTANGTGWYAVLVNARGDVLATYGNGSSPGPDWSSYAAGTDEVGLSASDELIVVSSQPYHDQGYGLSVYATSSVPVSGSVYL